MAYLVKKFAVFVARWIMAFDCEKVKYMLQNQRFDIELLVENILEDSEEDPHYSAVTATNLIKCYIEIMEDLGEKLPFSDVEGFVRNIGFSRQDYMLFEEKRKKEKEYYRGVQY